MSKGGISPRTAQAAMRHSKIDLTMTVYTDPRLLDVHGALDALPALPLDGGQTEREAVRATGTDYPQPSGVQADPRTLAPTLAPTPDNSGKSLSFPGKTLTDEPGFNPSGPVAVSGSADKRKEPLTSAVSGLVGVGATGLEPVTPSVSSWCSSQLS